MRPFFGELPATEAPMEETGAEQAVGPTAITDSTWLRTWKNTGKLRKSPVPAYLISRCLSLDFLVLGPLHERLTCPTRGLDSDHRRPGHKRHIRQGSPQTRASPDLRKSAEKASLRHYLPVGRTSSDEIPTATTITTSTSECGTLQTSRLRAGHCDLLAGGKNEMHVACQIPARHLFL